MNWFLVMSSGHIAVPRAGLPPRYQVAIRECTCEWSWMEYYYYPVVRRERFGARAIHIPKKNGEPRSYLEFSNHLVDYEYVEFTWVYDQYVIICGLWVISWMHSILLGTNFIIIDECPLQRQLRGIPSWNHLHWLQESFELLSSIPWYPFESHYTTSH